MRHPRAFCLIRQQPPYRHEAFEAGLAAAGYAVQHGPPVYPILPDEVLLIWNRYDVTEQMADQFEARGGTVLVAENGYLGVDRADRRIYAIARGRHNGGGWWPQGDAERFEKLGIELQPWRKEGGHILVAANRSFGTRGNIMPIGWLEDVARRLRQHTQRPIKLRPHPGNYDSKVPLARDLENAWAVVIWSSSVGVEALVRGIPVFCEANWWICKEASFGDIRGIELQGIEGHSARLHAMRRLAWAQWTVEEITSGLPFRQLCAGANVSRNDV